MSQTALPPGPNGHFVFGNLREFGVDVLGFFTRCAREYGDIVRLRLANRTAYLLNHPDYIEYVLVTNNKNFIKHSFFWRHMRKMFGQGLLTSEGDFWLRQRRLAQPAFHRDRIASYGEVMVAYAERMVDGWGEGEMRNLHEDLMSVTLEIVAKVLFDADVAKDVEAVGQALDAITRESAVRLRRPFYIPDAVPLPSNIRYLRAVRRMDKLVYRIIREHRGADQDAGDLLSMLLESRDEAGRGMSDRQLRDEAITILLAGHETVALALSWTWYLLSQHPTAEQQLVDELRRVLGDRLPCVSDLPALRYTERVIKEAMRLYPPVYSFGREAVDDCEIGGYAVPAGTTLFMSPWVMHRHPRYFEQPDAFLPERWDGDLVERLPKFAYFPFGGGPRLCIGSRFAMMEAVLLLAAIAQRFHLSLVPERPVTLFPSITLRPKDGVWVRLSER